MKIEDDAGLSGLLIRRGNPPLRRIRIHRGPDLDRVPTTRSCSATSRAIGNIAGARARARPRSTATPSGWSNGLTLDADGNLVACEHGGRRVSRGAYGEPGSAVAVADAWEGTTLNSPNDLVVHSSGAIFFTDPSYGTDSGRTPRFGQEGQRAELDFQGVYRIDPDGALALVAPTGFSQPNGLAFTPDESGLYIGDSQDGLIWRYEVNDDLTLGDRVLFVDQSARLSDSGRRTG